MAELTTVARPYAKAVFQYALENGELAAWSDMLGLAALVASDEVIQTLLSKPQLTAEEKSTAFISVCADKLSDAGKNLISILATSQRLSALPAIFILFEEFLAEQEKSVDVTVSSAFALSDAEVDKLVAALKSRLGREVKIETKVDSNLIGGVVIRAGDLVIDGSVKGKLAKLANTLNL